MFGVDSGELMLIVLVAVVVIGPKDLPRVMRTIGHWVGRARGMADQFRVGVDQMVRESEISDLEKKWREQNEAIMRANPMAPDAHDFAPPPAGEQAGSGWGLGLAPDPFADPVDPFADPVVEPLHRAAPAPPVGSLPAKPTPPRLDKDAAQPSEAMRPSSGAPRSPELSKAPPLMAPTRRPPRTAPEATGL